MREKLILSFVSVFVFFILAEFFVRESGVHIEFPQHFRFKEHFHIDPLLSEGFLLKDPYVFWRLAPNVRLHEVSAQGFRNGKDIFRKKKDGVFRIICIGDSVTYGIPEDVNRARNAYPGVLGMLFRTASKGEKIEVINAGVPGYTSYQGLVYLKRYLLEYQPDLVIAQFGINDAAQSVYYEDKDQRLAPAGVIRIENVLAKSKVYQLLSRLIFMIRSRNQAAATEVFDVPLWPQRVSPEDFKKNVETMIQLGREHGFSVIFLMPLFSENELTVGDDYLLPPGALSVDTYTAFKDSGIAMEDLFADECHLKRKGHKILAAAVYNFIVDNKMIGR